MRDATYLSVITPCYNGENHIESAILSVLNQPVQGIELIVINDGSTDKTAEICLKYAERIRYIESDNRGAGHARNVGMNLAKGKWIAFLDSDDLFLADSFTESVFEELKQLEKDGVDVVYTPWIYADMQLKSSLNVELSEEPHQIEHIPKHEIWTCLYQKKFLYDNDIRFYEYKEQDIATAFRYRVFSLSPKVVTKNDFRFILQRNNPESNTNTWKYQTMHSVKAAVYYDMFVNYANERSSAWLFATAVEQTRMYFGCVLKEGYLSELERRRMTALVKDILRHRTELYSSVQNVKYIYASAVIDRFARKGTVETSRKPKLHTGNRREDTAKILEKLKILSDFLHT